MKIFGFDIRRSQAEETRASIESQTVPVSSENFLAFFGINGTNLPSVTIDSALTVPAVLAAVAFLPRTLATLPLHAYRTTKEGAQRISGKLQTVVHDAPNDGMDSFKFRQYFWQQVFTGGRGLAWIERTPQGIEALWPMDPTKTTIKRVGLKTTYKVGGVEYPAADVIDVPFMLKADGLQHYGPIVLATKAIQLALAMNDYASMFFAGGGIPPLALYGPLAATPSSAKRTTDDINAKIKQNNADRSNILLMPTGHELKPIGFEPGKGQMVEARRFQIEEIARAYQLPPVFLQDLSHGTFTNTEQQGTILVKHLISQWAEALDGEMNLKMFGRGNTNRYVEHNLDGLMRGDFVARMAALASGIQNAILTPNEARALENRPAMPKGDDLLIQGATVPLGQQPDPNAKPGEANYNQKDEAEAA